MTAALPDILQSLRNALENDNIEINIAVTDNPVNAKYTLNDRELLAEMIKETPFIATFIDKLKLKLS